MKVIFELTTEQLERALERVIPPGKDHSPLGSMYRGNLLPRRKVKTPLTPTQSLDVQAPYLVYEGRRISLCHEGGLKVISEIAGYADLDEGYDDGFARLNVVAYQTTDPRLLWWETLQTYIVHRADIGEVADYVTYPVGKQAEVFAKKFWNHMPMLDGIERKKT